MKWRCATFEFDTKMPVIMGILNITPDSFSDGGLFKDHDAALAHALALVDEGAHIIDVGGESTRPGAEPVSCEEELARTVPMVKELASRGICVSIDTRNAEVARACIDAGASVINDVSGFRSKDMAELAASCDAGLVVMHMRGTPETMQQETEYTDVVSEVKTYLQEQATLLESHGIAPERMCIDPGPGFGKTAKQTLELVRNLHEFTHLGYPVMAALSRKSFLGYMYGIEVPRERDEVSAEEALMACELGAGVVRVHHVGMTVEALKKLRPYVYLGLGSNVALVAHPGEEREGKIALLNQAITELCVLPDSQLIDISSFYESEPAYYTEQDTFVNAVVLMRTGLPPLELLRYLHAIEDSLGRLRDIKNGPRTCDIDILDYQMYTSEDERVILPHPRLLERDFVVKPLLEISPRHVLADGQEVREEAATQGKAHLIVRGT